MLMFTVTSICVWTSPDVKPATAFHTRISLSNCTVVGFVAAFSQPRFSFVIRQQTPYTNIYKAKLFARALHYKEAFNWVHTWVNLELTYQINQYSINYRKASKLTAVPSKEETLWKQRSIFFLSENPESSEFKGNLANCESWETMEITNTTSCIKIIWYLF